MTETKQETLTPEQAIEQGYTHFFIHETNIFEPIANLQRWFEAEIIDASVYENIATDDYKPSKSLHVAEKTPSPPTIDAEDFIENITNDLYESSNAEDPDLSGIDAVVKDFYVRIEELVNDINKAIKDNKIDCVYMDVAKLDYSKTLEAAKAAVKASLEAEAKANA